MMCHMHFHSIISSFICLLPSSLPSRFGSTLLRGAAAQTSFWSVRKEHVLDVHERLPVVRQTGTAVHEHEYKKIQTSINNK